MKDQRLFEVPGDENCPVASLDIHLSKLHPDNYAFFQRPNPQVETTGVWYVNTALGVHSFDNMLKEIL